jgi:hypothetical protein
MEQLTWSAAASERSLDVGDLPSSIRDSLQPIAREPDRRRQVSDVLYQKLVERQYSFWGDVHPLFLNRDITRHDLRELVRRGLRVAGGSYQELCGLFAIPAADHKRFMRLLSKYQCRPDLRAPDPGLRA